MNDIFKIFKKRAQAGKSTNIKDVIKDLSENEKDEIGKFDRGNKSYLSISKSGRLKSKKASAQSANAHRMLNDDLFKSPIIQSSTNNNSSVNSNSSNSSSSNNSGLNSSCSAKTILQVSNGSLASSANSSFRSSLEDVDDMTSSSASSSSSIMITKNPIFDYGMKAGAVWQNKF